jgi:hypothetical protein
VVLVRSAQWGPSRPPPKDGGGKVIGHEQKLKSMPGYLAFAVASKSRNAV